MDTPVAASRSSNRPAQVMRVVVMLAEIVVLPALIVGAVAGSLAAHAFPLGLIGGLLIMLGEGRRIGFRFLIVLVPAAALSGLTNGTWWWVVVFGALGASIGLMSGRGHGVAMVQVAIIACVVPDIDGWLDAAVFAAFLTIGALFGVLLAFRNRAALETDHPPIDGARPVLGSALGALSLGAAAAMGLVTGWEQPYWVPLLFLLLVQFLLVDEAAGRRKVVQRVVGTVVGLAIVVPISMVVPRSVVVVLALVLIAISMTVSDDRYWIAAALITTAVVLVSGSASDSLVLGERRLLATLVGALLLVGVVTALRVTAPRGVDRPAR
jgi:hypothetical protein